MASRETFVFRNGKLVPKAEAQPLPSHGRSFQVMPDITPFQTAGDRVAITSRSELREYERRTGTRQIGNDFKPPRLPGEHE
jgi:hypothetical protein